MRLRCFAVWLTLWASAQAFDDVSTSGFEITDFGSNGSIRRSGSARFGGTSLQLTTATVQQTGAGWYSNKLFLRNGFDTKFQFQITDPGGLGNGADGLAFVIQNSGTKALGGRGSAGGFAISDRREYRRDGLAIPNSIAVFFDTFQNTEGRDPSDNFLVVCTSGKMESLRWPPPRLAIVDRLKVRLKDQRVHAAQISYSPPLLSVYLDDMSRPILTTPVELGTVLDGSGTAFIGFTASTGAGYANHEILNWSFAGVDVNSTLDTVDSQITYVLAECIDGRSLCTPARAIVEELGSDRYRVVLPAHLEWGATISNPNERRVEIANGRGHVCWDLERGKDGCGGPAQALIQRTQNGRTYFSVQDRSGAFGDNQGYFEFEAHIK